MNVYKVKYKSRQEEVEIDASDYKIQEGFVTFEMFGRNVGSVDASLIETVRFDRSKEIEDQEFEDLRQQFKSEYSK